MKKFSIFLSLLLTITMIFPLSTFADPGEGNLDGGGGDLEDGVGGYVWSPGNDGVRVTVVKDGTPVATPIDFSNKKPGVDYHFGRNSKMSYRSGGLSLSVGGYACEKPGQSMPTVISTSSGGVNIEAIKKYWCSEYAVKMVANEIGMNYDVLINGEYKIVVEPIAYLTYAGNRMAMTATEAALYDQMVNGNLRSNMGNLTHKNLPLAIFLEYSDLGYPAWSGTRTGFVSNEEIKSALGIGIVWFTEPPAEPPELGLETFDYEYRVDTEVITSVMVSGGQSDPDNETTVTFNILGTTYTVGNVYYPDGDGQLVWVRWRTPQEEQTLQIPVSVSGPGAPAKGTINVKIVDLDKNPPPNPVADDRNDSFSPASVPAKEQVTSNTWGVWVPWWQEFWVWIPNWVKVSGSCDSSCSSSCTSSHWEWEDHGWWEDQGWWEFDWEDYQASLTASMQILIDEKNPTATGRTMKSGYGVNQEVTSSVSTNMWSAVTELQNAVSYFPEFRYETYWRLLDRMGGGAFEFKENHYSTFKRRTHFTPIWYPDGSYTVYTWAIDCWTPAGMLSMNLSDNVTIQGNLWADWHIAPLFPS